MSKSSHAKNDSPPLDHAAAASLDKVRDILFGTQARQSEKRFDGIEKRLSKEIDALRKDHDKTIAALRVEMEKKFDGLAAALDTEKVERSEQVQAVETEVTGRLAEFEASAAAAQESLQAKLIDETQKMRDELAESEARQAQVLTEAMTQLRSELAGRSQVAQMFRDLADTMAGEG